MLAGKGFWLHICGGVHYYSQLLLFLWGMSFSALSLPRGGFHMIRVENFKVQHGTLHSLFLCHEICSVPERDIRLDPRWKLICWPGVGTQYKQEGSLCGWKNVTDIFQLFISVGYLTFADRQNEKALSRSQSGPRRERTTWRNEEFPGLEVFKYSYRQLRRMFEKQGGVGEGRRGWRLGEVNWSIGWVVRTLSSFPYLRVCTAWVIR